MIKKSQKNNLINILFMITEKHLKVYSKAFPNLSPEEVSTKLNMLMRGRGVFPVELWEKDKELWGEVAEVYYTYDFNDNVLGIKFDEKEDETTGKLNIEMLDLKDEPKKTKKKTNQKLRSSKKSKL